MTARLDDHRVRDLLLIALTASVGAIDAISWLVLGKVFSAFMTGNLVFLAFRTAGAAEVPSVPRLVAAVAGFAVGAALAARIVAPSKDSDVAWPHRVTVALGVTLVAQAAFLTLWLGVEGHPASRSGDALVAMSALAMGMQTTAVFSLGVPAVITTAATATWAVLMGDLFGWRDSSGQRRLLLRDILALFAGAVVGGLLVRHARIWAPVLPLALVSLVVGAAVLASRSRRLSTSVMLMKSLDAIHSRR